MKIIASTLLAIVSVFLSSCGEDKVERQLYGGVKEFAPSYNNYVREWLQREVKKAELEHKGLISRQASESSEELAREIVASERNLAKLAFRLSLGDYFQFKADTDVPRGLKWETGIDQPEIGDARATKGGVFTEFIPTFPSTLRGFGSESNSSFRGKIYDEIELKMIGAHPTTQKTIPGVANEWAVSEDGRTVFYRIDPEATYSDGVKVRSIDMMTAAYLRISDFVIDPYYKQYYREQIANITCYGDDIVSVTFPEEKPRIVLNAPPIAPTHFYKEYGPDFEKYYQWKVPPTTGAYTVKEGDVRKGVSVKLTRVKDWWAKDRKYYRHRFNPDNIIYLVVRDPNKAFELFRAGRIDTFQITSPKYWYDKTEIPPVFKGYIERYKFYNQYPRYPRGVYMNVTKPTLKDINVRLGIQHSLNWKRVIDVMFRGDYQRLNMFSDGFGEFSRTDIKARKYSVIEAQKYFRKAGFTELGDDGILKKPDGTRLSISMTFANAPALKTMMSILETDAKNAGFELRLDGQEATVSYQTVMKKQHELTFWAWGTSPPFPRYYQFFHSKNAVDSKGNPKASTNNINCYSNKKMDVYAEAMRNARTEDELKKNALDAQKLIYDEAIFSPGYKQDYYSVGSWRWVRWPETFNPPISGDYLEYYVFWIDEKLKKETIQSKVDDKSFPEVLKVIDVFKNGIPEKYKKSTK